MFKSKFKLRMKIQLTCTKLNLAHCTYLLNLALLFYWGFTLFSIFIQSHHGDSSLVHDPWVKKSVLG